MVYTVALLVPLSPCENSVYISSKNRKCLTSCDTPKKSLKTQCFCWFHSLFDKSGTCYLNLSLLSEETKTGAWRDWKNGYHSRQRFLQCCSRNGSTYTGRGSQSDPLHRSYWLFWSFPEQDLARYPTKMVAGLALRPAFRGRLLRYTVYCASTRCKNWLYGSGV